MQKKSTITEIVSVANIEKQQGVIIYPNPFKGRELTIELPMPYNETQICVFDITGKIVLNK